MKKAMEYVITKLTPMDRLSIVSAVRSNDGKLSRSRQCPLRCMTPAGQTDLKAVINNMLGIAITHKEALREAMAVIRGRRHTEGRTANILILSDNRGYETTLHPGNMVVHTFGFGVNINHKVYSLRPNKNDVLGFKFCPKRMTFYLIWHWCMCM
jgi:hypothetical protein